MGELVRDLVRGVAGVAGGDTYCGLQRTAGNGPVPREQVSASCLAFEQF